MVHPDIVGFVERKWKLERNAVQQAAALLLEESVVYLYPELGIIRNFHILLATNHRAVNVNTINIFTPVTTW